jgi:hypothetical protein
MDTLIIQPYETKCKEKELFNLFQKLYQILKEHHMKVPYGSKAKYAKQLQQNYLNVFMLVDLCDRDEYKVLLIYLYDKKELDLNKLEAGFKNTKEDKDKILEIKKLWVDICGYIMNLLENKKEYFE